MDEGTEGGGLRSRSWRRFFSAPDPTLLRDLYEPALASAVQYDRCCAYFSSSVLAAAARGFGPFIDRLVALGDEAPRPAVRLMVNEQLEESDVRALLEQGDLSALERVLLDRLTPATDILQRRRLEMLGFLYERGLLDIRVGVMRSTDGILHGKFGLVYDGTGDALVFAGSDNESASGVRGNYEQIEVSGSWQDVERFEHFRREFDELWDGTHPYVASFSLPDAARQEILRITNAPSTPPRRAERELVRERQEAVMRLRFAREAPFLVGESGLAACDATAFVTPWPHQIAVVNEVTAAWPDGRLLCDEVGMGKTIEAILVLRRLLHGRGVRRALLLVPAGLLKQWQEELREKGGMLVAYLQGDELVWPDGTRESTSMAEALAQPVLLISRELARLEQRREILLTAEPWDLVLLDESHAARRAEQVETEFNSATLLLELLRTLQLTGQGRSFLLLSATPMQTHPWEPFDLLQVLGEGDRWLADFDGVRTYYRAAAALESGRECAEADARTASRLVAEDDRISPPLHAPALEARSTAAVAEALTWAPASDRSRLGSWLRREAPLTRRMHRNTRDTLRTYFRRGLLSQEPPRRVVEDLRFDYEDPSERATYDAVSRYIERRFTELEQEQAGKGFVMTVYRRRASSSPQALRRSLERRKQGLESVIAGALVNEQLEEEELRGIDTEEAEAALPARRFLAAYPEDPEVAREELADVEGLLARLDSLAGVDTKRNHFFEVVRRLTGDGRAILVFTETTDTMEYLRDGLLALYGTRVATYSGRGGEIWDGLRWRSSTKADVTDRLHRGELDCVVCTDAASEGLNLQAAGALVNYDLPWNPSRVEQRIGRIDRIGQRHPEVRVVNMFLRDSIDDRVYQVLSQRCDLFQHFIGEMQPVLARARRLLLGRDANLDVLTEAAAEVEADPLAPAIYGERAAEDIARGEPAVDAEWVLSALERAQALVTQHSPVRFSISEAELEAEPELLPGTPDASPLLGWLEHLGDAEANVPLVVGTSALGSFRASSALWVDPQTGESRPIFTAHDLERELLSWDGLPVPEDALASARGETVAVTQQEVHRRNETTGAAWSRGLDAQVAAASIRLRRELLQYLLARASLPPTATGADVSSEFARELNLNTAAASRFQRAAELLGGIPVWDSDEVASWRGALGLMRQASRQALLSLTAVDAALADPRWTARTALGNL